MVRAVARLGIIYLWQLASENKPGSFVKQCGALFLIASMLTETLISGSAHGAVLHDSLGISARQ
jgi:hypothetical protein